MSEGERGAHKGFGRYAPGLLVLLAVLGLIVAEPIGAVLPDLLHRLLGVRPALESFVAPVVWAFWLVWNFTLVWLVRFAPVAVGLGFLGRLMARARLRAGFADPLDRLRAWATAHPRWARALTAAPTALWLRDAWYVVQYEPAHTVLTHQFAHQVPFSDAQSLPALAVLAIALYVMTSLGVRSLLAPTLSAPGAPARAKPPSAAALTDEITFDAVAVTRETVGAVVAMMGLSVATIAWLASSHATRADWPVIGAFIAVALGGAALFRRASRVAVGMDGVLVSGSSRTRFFAYRDLDEVRDERGDVELVRRGRVLVRLQLHGDDALERDAVVARIRGAIDRVKAGAGAASAQMLATATADELARAAAGGADYRGAALTREQLWALVEGPEIDTSARRAAAEALAMASDDADRARLRVAAEHCAAPEARVALERLADGEPLEDEGRVRPERIAERRGVG